MTDPVHDFNERLSWSQDASCEEFWDGIYHKAFPNLVGHLANPEDSASQRAGIDRVLFLTSGKTLYIDEKKREKVWQDILIEYISADSTSSPGWIEKDLPIDYLAYAFMPIKRCYLFDWRMLQRAWKEFKVDWKNQYRTVTARNERYNTLSLAVPITILRSAISRSAIIELP